MRTFWIFMAVLTVPLLIILLSLGDDDCLSPEADMAVIDTAALPKTTVAGYGTEQLTNAAVIANTAASMGLDAKAKVIGIMTAMGESSLRNLEHGDEGDGVKNPDGTATCSLGLFQQQWCLPGSPWGSKEDVLNTVTASKNFFTALKQVDGWEEMEPILAANAVQGNARPDHYAPYLANAQTVFAAILNVTVNVLTNPACTVPDGAYPDPGGKPPGAWGGFANGKIPESLLTPIPWTNGSHRLRGDATGQLIALNNAFRQQFGRDLTINDGYRDYDDQVEAKRIYGGEAATPGTSIHGWALAIDVGTIRGARLPEASPEWQWLNHNAGRYGWVNPEYMRTGGTGPYEPWHWEYYGSDKEGNGE